jgi:hypothetical protein
MNLILGATMPLSVRALSEVSAWRDLKYVDGSLNMGHKILSSAAAAMIAVVSLVEGAVRFVFCFLLSPMIITGEKGRARYAAFVNGTVLNVFTPLYAIISAIGFLSSRSHLTMKRVEDGKDMLSRLYIEEHRDMFRGDFYETIHDPETGSVTRKPIKVTRDLGIRAFS